MIIEQIIQEADYEGMFNDILATSPDPRLREQIKQDVIGHARHCGRMIGLSGYFVGQGSGINRPAGSLNPLDPAHCSNITGAFRRAIWREISVVRR